MTRKKYSYDRFILESQYRVGSNEYLAAKAVAAAEIKGWVSWSRGIDTHKPDGTYTPELTEWLKVNERCIEIMGYGVVGEPLHLWNPQVESWTIDKFGAFQYSAIYWEYLISEGYVKRWIECCQSRLAGELRSLSYSFPDAYLHKRIQETEIPQLEKYDPIDGLFSESKIYGLQQRAQENPARENKIISGITWNGARGL
jgi:hypothetical protein